ncbi:hypothetical protein RFI_14543, partial [Reticulomyxa filosa]
ELAISHTNPLRQNKTEDIDSKSEEIKTSDDRDTEQMKRKQKVIKQYKYWSDYLSPALHHKSLFLLPGIHYHSTPFHLFSQGYDLISNSSTMSSEVFEDIQDRIRYFVELCDCFQGMKYKTSSFFCFQIFCGGNYDGWSGIVPGVVNDIVRDDYGSRKTILMYDCQPLLSAHISSHLLNSSVNTDDQISVEETARSRSQLNNIISFTQVWGSCNQIIPLSVDHWRKLGRSDYFLHSLIRLLSSNIDHLWVLINSGNTVRDSSIMGAAIHQHNSICRVKHSHLSLADIIDMVTLYPSMKMAMLSTASSHIPMDLNYQLMDSIQQLFALPVQDKKKVMPPIFHDRLMCLSPIPDSYFSDHSSGEHSSINGSSIYQNNDSNKQEKLKLLSLKHVSPSDITAVLMTDMNTHQRLYAKLLSGGGEFPTSIYPRNGHLIYQAWKFPSNFPFSSSSLSAQVSSEDTESDFAHTPLHDSDYYSMWSSLWTGKVVGEYHLNRCSKELTQIIRGGNAIKLLGDNVDLDLTEMKENLLGWADSYQPLS